MLHFDRFFDLAAERTSAVHSKENAPRLQHMFQLGEDSSHDEEDTDTSKTIPKCRNVQFPPHLEQRFYVDEPKPPMEEQVTPPSPPTKKERVLHYLHVKFPSRIVRRVLKCTIAYFLTALFSLIAPLGQAIGPAPFLCTTGMLFSHPGRSMGAQFDATVTAVLGVVAAILFAFAGLASAVAYNVAHPDTYITQPTGRVINCVFLFVGIFAAQMLRQVFPKFHFFSLQFMIIQIFSMSRGINYTAMPYDLPLNYGIPLIIGHGISLVVNLFCWPETAVDGLGKYRCTCCTIQALKLYYCRSCTQGNHYE